MSHADLITIADIHIEEIQYQLQDAHLARNNAEQVVAHEMDALEKAKLLVERLTEKLDQLRTSRNYLFTTDNPPEPEVPPTPIEPSEPEPEEPGGTEDASWREQIG